MKFGIKSLIATTFLLGVFYQSSVFALTDYVATGSFFGDLLEVIQYVEDPEEGTSTETQIDAFVGTFPFPLSTSTFTLGFTVDETVNASISFMNPTGFFSGAISNVSLDINGVTVFTSANEVATVSQFPGDFLGTFPARWSWSLFPEFAPFSLPELDVFDNENAALLGTITAQGLDFRLFDSTRQVYESGSVLDMIALSLADFDSTSFQLSWESNLDEEPEFGEETLEIYYSVFASVDSVTNLSAVPLPGGIWLLLSGITGFFVAACRDRAE